MRWAIVALATASLLSSAWLLSSVPVRAQEPARRVAVIVEVAPDPLLGPDGQALEETAAILSRYTTMFERLSRSQAPIALSVSPIFVEELRVLGSRGARPYAALLRLASSRPLLSRPRADVQLPHLASEAAMRAELNAGADSLLRQVDVRPLPVLHPPALDVSDATLRAAHHNRLSATLVPSRELTGTVRTGGVQLIPTIASGSRELVENIEAGNDEAVAVVPDDPQSAPAAIEALSADDRFVVVPLTDLVGDVPERPVAFRHGPPPPEYYWDAVQRADESLDAFATYTPGTNATREMLDVLLALSRSSVHWRDQWERASELAGAIVDRISEERDLVSSSAGSVTLTSQRGAVPVTVINRAQYPVRVRVRVRSPRLSFPEGATQVINVSPRGATLTFVAEARSPGSFPMTVLLTSPDGAVEFDTSEVLVRSTAARIPALVLTAGAALFLLAWSSRGFVKRRRDAKR